MLILNYYEIGQRIKQKRKALSLTQFELAMRVDLTESSISRYESGKIATMPTSTIKKICEVLQMDTTELLGLESNSFEYDLKEILSQADVFSAEVKDELLNIIKLQIKLLREVNKVD